MNLILAVQECNETHILVYETHEKLKINLSEVLGLLAGNWERTRRAKKRPYVHKYIHHISTFHHVSSSICLLNMVSELVCPQGTSLNFKFLLKIYVWDCCEILAVKKKLGTNIIEFFATMTLIIHWKLWMNYGDQSTILLRPHQSVRVHSMLRGLK